jgi:hypothetical protein
LRHPIDVIAMFAAIWLLASMVLDALTPRELTVYMIGVAIGPAVIATAVFYYLRFPRIDFVVLFAALWLASGDAIGLMSPRPLPSLLIGMAFIPPLLVGCALHLRRYRRRRERTA